MEREQVGSVLEKMSMNIAFFPPSFLPKIAGLEKACDRLAGELYSRRHSPVILAQSFSGQPQRSSLLLVVSKRATCDEAHGPRDRVEVVLRSDSSRR
jgi:hypothetical protein